MTGESYSGKYLPVFSHAMLVENEKMPTISGKPYFNLAATLIGDGYPAPYQQRLSMYKVPQALNILD
jgi:carboxypeptidase C (cathepsin A)